MLKEHTPVVLQRPLVSLGLLPGTNGVVVHSYKNRDAYDVEFMTEGGQTICVATVSGADLVQPTSSPNLIDLVSDKSPTGLEATAGHEASTIRDFKQNPQLAAEYLHAVLDDGDDSELASTIRRIEEAFGDLSRLAKLTTLRSDALELTRRSRN